MLPSVSRSSKWSASSGFLTNVIYTLCMLHVHIFVLDFVTLILFGAMYELYDSSPSCYFLCSVYKFFLQHYVLILSKSSFFP